MTRTLLAALIFIVYLPFSSQASDFAIETAHDYIDITVGFNGSTIELFGDRRDPGTDIAIVVEGPEKDVTIWKKERIMGTWVNRRSVTFNDIPIYYHYAVSTEDVSDALKAAMIENGVGHDALFNKTDVKTKVEKGEMNIFEQALLGKKQVDGSYFKEPAEIKFITDNFFRVRFDIPPSAPTGDYKIHSFLIKEGRVVERALNLLKIKQVGVNALVYRSAHDYSLIYALVCVALALFSGWIVSVLRVKP